MEAFTALADPTRLRIVELLGQYGALPAGSISEQFDMSAPAISQHLRILKKANLVQVKSDAQRRIYSLDSQGIDAVQEWVAHMKAKCEARVDTLDHVLEEENTMRHQFTFTIERTFNASRDRVWQAWTDEKQLAAWFGPQGCTIFHSKLDLHEGGIFHYGMGLPDGSKIWGKWTFSAINKPNEFNFVFSFTDQDGKQAIRNPWNPIWPLETHSIITFVENNDKTTVKLTSKALKATEMECQNFEEGNQSMTQGWGGTFDQLEAYLNK